jgi:hypothetical protein
MTCIWRIHGSKLYIGVWFIIHRYSVFHTFIWTGWVGGLSQMKLTSFEKNSHFEIIPYVNMIVWLVYIYSNGIRTIMVIDTDCTVSYKSNYNTITTTMAPEKLFVLYNTIFHLHRHIFPCSTTFTKLSAG